MDCNCPNSGIHTDIPSSDCPFDLKQIQRIAFATKGEVIWDSASGGGAGDGVPNLTGQLDTKADWVTLLAAVDKTKIVITPLVGGEPKIEAGEAITEGGNDNSTLNGVELVTGTGPSKFSAEFRSISPEQEKAIKAITCINSEVYFFTEAGKIVAYKPSDTAENVRGFNMQSFFFSDRNNEGFGTKDTNVMSFSLPSGWSEDLVLVEPLDFNPLYDI